MDIAIIRDEISLLTRNSVEADVRAFWHMVLREYFPSSEGYVVKDEAPNKFGISDIIVYEHRRTLGGTLIQHCFLIVQCKRVSLETQDAVWAEAEDRVRGVPRAHPQTHKAGEQNACVWGRRRGPENRVL